MDCKSNLDSLIIEDDPRLGGSATPLGEIEEPVIEPPHDLGAGTKMEVEIPTPAEEMTDLGAGKFSYTCNLCGRKFRSGKSLGGHISRSHVQKDRRSLGGDFQQDERYAKGQRRARRVGDLADYVGGGWSSTGRRGQKFNVRQFDFADYSTEEERTEAIDGAWNLVKLRQDIRLVDYPLDASDISFYNSLETLAGRIGNGTPLVDEDSKQIQLRKEKSATAQKIYEFDLNQAPPEEDV